MIVCRRTPLSSSRINILVSLVCYLARLLLKDFVLVVSQAKACQRVTEDRQDWQAQVSCQTNNAALMVVPGLRPRNRKSGQCMFEGQYVDFQSQRKQKVKCHASEAGCSYGCEGEHLHECTPHADADADTKAWC